MVVLSCFDGMSCGQIALERAGVPVELYMASEIDKYAMQVTQRNYPKTVQLGSIVDLAEAPFIPTPDLIIGGSPCQGFSFAGNQLNFDDPRSKLLFDFVKIVEEFPGAYFLLENVQMKKEYQDIISLLLGVEPIKINSALVSAQNRRRLYWTNIPGITQPGDKGIYLKDILESCGTHVVKNHGELIEKGEKSMCLDANYYKGEDNHGQRTLILTPDQVTRALESHKTKQFSTGNRRGNMKFPNDINGKVKTLLTLQTAGNRTVNHVPVMFTETRTEEAKAIRRENQKQGRDFSPRRGKKLVPRKDDKSNCLTTGLTNEHLLLDQNSQFRKLTPTECERLQTVPEGYTGGLSDNQRYKMLGNGWTVDVIAHIFSFIPKKYLVVT